tara:strand:+ start:72 stop:1343 length:1272 start_codon:yes stop_codon:yes gene_type:complete
MNMISNIFWGLTNSLLPASVALRIITWRAVNESEDKVELLYFDVRDIRKRKPSKDAVNRLIEAPTRCIFGPNSEAFDQIFSELSDSLVLENLSSLERAYGYVGPKTKATILFLIGRFNSKEAVEAVGRLLSSAGPLPSRLRLWFWSSNGLFTNLVLSTIMPYLEHRNLQFDILLICYRYLTEGGVSPGAIHPYRESILRAFVPFWNRVLKAQRRDFGRWLYREKYSDLRSEAALFLDVLGFIQKGSSGLLREALKVTDPKLVFYAITACFRLNLKVPAKSIAHVAKDLEMRSALFELLEEQGQLNQFPRKYSSQNLLAESDFSRWLVADIGEPPIKITLEDTFEFRPKDTGRILAYFIFRFTVSDKSKPEWFAGIAGPYPIDGAPTAQSLESPFCSFEPWESMDPIAHLGRVREILDEWNASS